jgi:hypothetical protein
LSVPKRFKQERNANLCIGVFESLIIIDERVFEIPEVVEGVAFDDESF